MKYVNVVYLGGGWGYFEKGRIHTNHFKRPLPQKKNNTTTLSQHIRKGGDLGRSPSRSGKPPLGGLGGPLRRETELQRGRVRVRTCLRAPQGLLCVMTALAQSGRVFAAVAVR